MKMTIRKYQLAVLAVALAGTMAASAESYTITIKPGYNFIVNQLNNPAGNTLEQIMPAFGPDNDGSFITTYDVPAQNMLNMVSSFDGFDDPIGWSANVALPVGQGFFFSYNGVGDLSLTFTGTRVSDPTLITPLSNKYQWVGNQLPEVGTWDSIFDVAPGAGTIVYRYNNSNAPTSKDTFNGSTWSLGAPTANVGEAWNVYYVAPVPEPSSLGLLIGGLSLLVGIHRARRRNLPINPSRAFTDFRG